ncbi:MAG TPA: hypothetical protein VLX92_01590 [Kofleriaceae bacterium]|nr:hypothetical protein [Kofleriaceae bacterium]
MNAHPRGASASHSMTLGRNRAIAAAVWTVLAAPAVYQLVLLVTAIAGRIAYPYDLEWMEGGLLHHAQRLADGHGIYAAPSIEFIPYLYTPLYPALLALCGKIVGLGYTLGRAISVLSLVGIAVVGAVSIAGERFRQVARGPAWGGVVIALGVIAAAYPYLDGWYDLVRADTMFAFLVTVGLAAAAQLGRDDRGWRGHARAGVVAAILVLAFFAKQTGVIYVGLGGAIVLVQSWRRAATYTCVAAVLGIGGSVLMNIASDGWFWIYVSKIHRAHDFNMKRFKDSFGYILWHFPAMSVVIAVTLGVVVYTWLRPPPSGRRRELPRQALPFLLWTAAFAVSVVVGAIGFGTEFARSNAYMPAFLHGALAVGAALPALAACTGILWGSRPHATLAVHGAAALAALALAVTLWHARWAPAQFVPRPADVAAGDRLIARLRGIEGDVWMPFHPWYLALAGKQPHVHRMGVMDVTRRQSRAIAGLDDALRSHRFTAVVLDNRDVSSELPELKRYYRPALTLPADERPRLYTGAGTAWDPWGCCLVPDAIWVPAAVAVPPAGAGVLFDFEEPSWAAARWARSGPAWGDGPVGEALPGQDLVVGASGHRFATSMHGGDIATGRVTSPPFAINGAKISLEVGGGTDTSRLRVELWVDDKPARTTGVPLPGGDTLRSVSWDVTDLIGKQATLVLVDDSTTGHLDVDDVWIWANP